jgi:hypothetical protein
VTLHYDADADIIDPGAGYLDTEGVLHWNYSLLETNTTTLSFWLWPKASGTLKLESAIYYERNGDTSLYDQYTREFEIKSTPAFSDVLALIELEDQRIYKQALGFLEKARDAETDGKFDQAMDFALKTADKLSAINTERADELHYQLAQAIKALAMNYTK